MESWRMASCCNRMKKVVNDQGHSWSNQLEDDELKYPPCKLGSILPTTKVTADPECRFNFLDQKNNTMFDGPIMQKSFKRGSAPNFKG
jgi:hypothetical protein